MRTFVWIVCLIVAVFLAAPAAWAQTPARCGFSLGLGAGAGVPTDSQIRDEIPYEMLANLDFKYYVWKPFSLGASLGFYYGAGNPTRIEWHDEWIDLDREGVSFLRSADAHGVARVEIGRYWRFNPYVGGGAGVLFNTLDRAGVLDRRKVTDYYQEFVPSYLALVGYDFNFDPFMALKMEARWTFAKSNDSFVDKRDLGIWYGLIGIQIYL